MRRTRPIWTLAAAILLGMALLPGGVAAQAGEDSGESAGDAREVARGLFAEGVEAANAGEWDTAAAKFEAALEAHRAPTIEFNLASAYVELGRLGEAGDILARLDTDPEVDESLRGPLEDLETHLDEQAGVLLIEVQPTAEGATVTVDGYTVPPERVGVPRHESPGTHTVTLQRADESSESRQVEVVAERPTTVTFDDAIIAADSEGAGASELSSDWRFWAVVGGGVAAVILIATVIAVASSSDGAVEGDYQPAVIRF